jgi:hypothetical protein
LRSAGKKERIMGERMAGKDQFKSKEGFRAFLHWGRR